MTLSAHPDTLNAPTLRLEDLNMDPVDDERVTDLWDSAKSR